MRPLLPKAQSTRLLSQPDPRGEPAGVMQAIRARGAVRVGVLQERLPYAYEDKNGELVGLDIEMAHQLARDLNVRLEFVPITAQRP